MRIVAAPNTLRGSLNAMAAADAIARGVRRALPHAEIVSAPIADGGDLTAAILSRACGGTLQQAWAKDPLGRLVSASWALLEDGSAVIEAASASGLWRLERAEYDPIRASSYGTGQLLIEAMNQGCQRIVVGLGGTATVDGGMGLFEALGARFLDRDGATLGNVPAALERLDLIDLENVDPRAKSVSITVACDVDNPLLGPSGAARVFAPQKGATPEGVLQLERGLGRLAEVVFGQTGVDVGRARHTGAAGGIAASLHALLGAELVSGIELVLEKTRFLERMSGSDLVITCEGKLDGQTLGRKGPFGVAQAARSLGVPVLALAGSVDDQALPDLLGVFDAVIPICRRPASLAEAMSSAAEWLELAAECAMEVFCLGERSGRRPRTTNGWP